MRRKIHKDTLTVSNGLSNVRKQAPINDQEKFNKLRFLPTFSYRSVANLCKRRLIPEILKEIDEIEIAYFS